MASVGFCPTGWKGAMKFPKRIRPLCPCVSAVGAVSSVVHVDGLSSGFLYLGGRRPCLCRESVI